MYAICATIRDKLFIDLMGSGHPYQSFRFLRDTEGYIALSFVFSLYLYTYYTFVAFVLIPIRNDGLFFWIVVIQFHLTAFMTFWSLFNTMGTHPGSPHLQPSTYEMGFKLCKKCKEPKPPRTHHCSSCNACVLRMDHHCPFVNNCIGWRNHKQFILFLLYHEIHSFLALLWTPIAILKHPFPFDPLHLLSILQIVSGFLIGLVFAAGVMIMVFLQVRVALCNATTIEYMEEKYQGENPFYLSFSENFYQTFGGKDLWYLWCLPVQSNYKIGDGTSFSSKTK